MGSRAPRTSPRVRRLYQTGFWKSKKIPRTQLPLWALPGGSRGTLGSAPGSGQAGTASGLEMGTPTGPGRRSPECAEVRAATMLPTNAGRNPGTRPGREVLRSGPPTEGLTTPAPQTPRSNRGSSQTGAERLNAAKKTPTLVAAGSQS